MNNGRKGLEMLALFMMSAMAVNRENLYGAVTLFTCVVFYGELNRNECA